MTNRIEQLHGVLEKYRFTDPARPELQEHIRRIKRDQFRKTLKRTGGYSVTFAVISYIYFTLKKMGIGITVYKSAVLLTLGSSVAAVSMGAGAYYAVKHFTAPWPETEVQERIMEMEAVPEAPSEAGRLDKRRAVVKEDADTIEKIERRIGIQPFKEANTDTASAGRVTDMVAEGLIALRGIDYVINQRKEKKGKRSGMILKGSVEFINGRYNITAKLIDVKTLRVIFYTAEPAFSEEEIAGACARIAERIDGAPGVPQIPRGAE